MTEDELRNVEMLMTIGAKQIAQNESLERGGAVLFTANEMIKKVKALAEKENVQESSRPEAESVRIQPTDE